MSKSLQNFYEEYGIKWDEPSRKKYEELASQWKVDILCDILPEKYIETIMELGCGPANILKHIGERVRASKLIGIDISHSMLEIAKKNLRNKNAILLQGIDFSACNEDIDLIIMVDILEHVQDVLKMLNDSSLKGKYILIKVPIEKSFIMTTCNKLRGKSVQIEHPEGHLHIWGKDDFINIVEKSDLCIVRYELRKPPYHILKFGMENNGFIKSICSFIFCKVGSTFSKYFPDIGCSLFGSNMFLLCKPKRIAEDMKRKNVNKKLSA
jgi:SAM-dependent methyltransferase